MVLILLAHHEAIVTKLVNNLLIVLCLDVMHAWTAGSDMNQFQEELRHIIDIPSAPSLKPGLPTARLFGIFRHHVTPVFGLQDEEEFISNISAFKK